MTNQHKLLAAAATIAVAAAAHAQTPNRSIWFWNSPKSPYGSVNVVGNGAAEDAAVARLKGWGVTVLYGSYKADPAAIRAWNRKLTHAGISSFLLLSETEYIFPTTHPALDSKLQADFVAFNKSAAPNERFSGLAFDVEPHILQPSSHAAGWKAADPSTRRQYLEQLLALYKHVRTVVPAGTLLEATLPSWFSHLTGSIGWANAADRDQYFTALSSTCDRLSIMAFELDSADKVLSRTSEEATALHGHARIALRANLGQEWKTVAQFWQAAHEVEAATQQGIEIQDFALLATDEDPPSSK